MRYLKRFFKDENAQGMTEYIIIVVVVAIAAIGAWKFYEWKLSKVVKDAGNSLQNLNHTGTGSSSTGAGGGGSTPFGSGF